ncbi:MAG: GtrA family protein [Paludibacter sp.]|nr:GtrA family protein [Paludibacter sp.]
MFKIIDYKKKILTFFYEDTNNTFVQLFRYTQVGGIAFIVDFGLLLLLTEYFNVHYLISAGISFLIGLLLNYYLSIKWVFTIRTFEKKWIELLFFSLIGLIGLGLNEFLLWVFTDILLLYYLISKFFTSFIVYFWNFFVRKFLLFTSKRNINE